MLTIRKEFLGKIIAHSRSELPNEACGILAGRQGVVEKAYEMTNAEKSPQNFFMDAREQLKVTKEIRNLGLEMVGIYHSHVASHAYPSAHDIELAFYPDVSYAIVSFKDINNPSVRSFKIKDKQITEEEVKIIDS